MTQNNILRHELPISIFLIINFFSMIKKTLLILFVFCSFISISQDRKLNKILDLINQNEIEDLDKSLEVLIGENPNLATCYFIKSKLLAHNNYILRNIDSSYYFVNIGIRLLNESSLNDKESICKKFKFCDFNVSQIKDSLSLVKLNELKLMHSIKDIENFIQFYKESSSIVLAENYLETLYFKKVTQENTTESYLEFIHLYPSSDKLDIIKSNINDLEYKKAEVTNTVKNYEEYIVNYPNSKHIEKANIKIEKLLYEELKSNHNLELYSFFLDKYPFSKFYTEVLNLSEYLAFEAILESNKLNKYLLFDKRYPNSRHKTLIKNKIIFCKSFNALESRNKNELYDFQKEYPNSLYDDQINELLSDLTVQVPFLTSNGKYKYIDKNTTKILIDKEFKIANLFHKNQAIVMINDKYGVINEEGKFIIQPKFDSIIYDDLINRYIVGLENNNNKLKLGLYTKTGVMILNCKYDYLRSKTSKLIYAETNEVNEDKIERYFYKFFGPDLLQFSESNLTISTEPYFYNGLAVVEIGEWNDDGVFTGKFGVINEETEIVIDIKYDYISETGTKPNYFYFNFGCYTREMSIEGGKWGLMDVKGDVIIPNIYDGLNSRYSIMDSNLIIVNKGAEVIFLEDEVAYGGKWGVVNFKNQLIIPLEYDEIFYTKGVFVAKKIEKIIKNNKEHIIYKYGVINSNNEIVTPFIYDYIDESLWVCRGCVTQEMFDLVNGTFGVINNLGETVLPLIYSSIWRSEDSLYYHVNKGLKYEYNKEDAFFETTSQGKNGLYSITGKEIIPVKFDDLQIYDKVIIAESNENKFHLFNKNGILINNIVYDEIRRIDLLNDYYFSFRKVDKWGILNKNGEEIIPAKFLNKSSSENTITTQDDYFLIDEGNGIYYVSKTGVSYKY